MNDAGATIMIDDGQRQSLINDKDDKKIRVWDSFVRVFHWSLASLFLANFFELTKAGKTAHQAIGYIVVALVLARVVWGFVGARSARSADFVRHPREVIGYLRDVAKNRDRRHVGHNPAGGAMVVAMLSGLGLVALTGWMQTTDRFFGVDWVEGAHAILVNLLFAMVVLHVLGVLHASWRHRENLVSAMFTGKKRAPGAHSHAIADRRG